MFVHSVGHFHPENVIDNSFLASLDIGIDEAWAVSRTGIHTRHTVLPLDYIRTTRNQDIRAATEACLYTNAQTGAAAARMAIDRAGITASQIGMVIAGGCAPWMPTPPEACLVAEQLGISAPCFDINSACSTLAAQFRMLTAMRRDSLPDYVLLVIADNLTRTVNYADRSDAVLMGDASFAAVVSLRLPAAITVEDSELASDPANWRKVSISPSGRMCQEGSSVQNYAIRKTSLMIERLRPRDASFWFIGHQANLPMLESAARRTLVPRDRHLYNIDTRGDCGAAGGPSVLSEQFHLFQPGDYIVLALVGAGLSWGGVRFACSLRPED